MRTIIGLEVHIELALKRKMFCDCDSDHFAKVPNSQVCSICLGLPGALPFPNQIAIENIIKFGLALNLSINKKSKFDRKHYFYPDLAKGYQITQYDLPFCKDGYWISEDNKKIRIKRIHLEEDTAKLVHYKKDSQDLTLVDFNRSGVALAELVTEPDFEDVREVIEFLQDIQNIVRTIGISNADMEKGSMRLEANVSMSNKNNDQLPNYKVELKNINSFKFLEKAIIYEQKRQSDLINKGKTPTQETRGYDQSIQKTFSQREKEEAFDYRYFPEPDIPPFVLSDSLINEIKDQIPELPKQKAKRFVKDYLIKESYATYIAKDSYLSDYFEKAVKLARKYNLSITTLTDLIINKKLHTKYEEAELLVKKLIEIETKDNYSTDIETTKAIEKVLISNGKAVDDYKSGNFKVLGFLIGQIQKELSGKGEYNKINEILIKKLH